MPSAIRKPTVSAPERRPRATHGATEVQVFLGPERTRELLAIINRAGSISLQDFARAAFAPDAPVWQSPPPERRRRNWQPGGRARSSAAALLGQLREHHLVWSPSRGVFQLTDSGRELLLRQPGAAPGAFPTPEPPAPDDHRWGQTEGGDRLLVDGATGNSWRLDRSGRLQLRRAGMEWERFAPQPAPAPPPAAMPTTWTDVYGQTWFRGASGDVWAWDHRVGAWARVA